MFEIHSRRSSGRTALNMLELIYHSIVRDIRKEHRNAIVGLLLNVLQTVIFVGVFYFMSSVLGLKGNAVRGDFLLYVMSGIFMFMTHNKAMSAVLKAEGPASAMMKHAPMNTVVAICASALGGLYIQILSLLVVLFIYHVAFTPVVIDRPVGAMGMLLLSWFSGTAIGMVFLSVKPWFPGFVTIASSIYARANMISSGKMFLANSLPPAMLNLFDWNPLFHSIDQARGYVFINYNPHNSDAFYALKLSIVLIMIGMMLEFFTRKHASASWDATR